VCEVAEGRCTTVGAAGDKQRPRNGYSAKFATPYLLANRLRAWWVGLGAFTESAIGDPACSRLRQKVKFVIDPQIPIRTITPAISARP